MSLAHSLKWSFLAELASKAVTPVVFIILARLLTPEDFGVMSAAVMVIAFSQIFWEAGMGKALIQRQTDVIEAANVAFWVNIALGIVIAFLLFWGAKPIAMTFFQDQRVAAVLQVMTLQVILGSLSSVQTALIQKEMGFKKLFWVRLITVAFPGMASIPLAWSGLGYWALVAGALMGQLVQVAMLWRMSVWRPSWRFDPVVAKEMGRFGVWVGASGLLAWFYGWADSLVVGKYLGTHDLGMYRTANQIPTLAFSLLFGPIIPIFYSHLSRFSANRIWAADALKQIIRVISFISVPVAFLIYIGSGWIQDVVFPSSWEGIGEIIGVLALSQGLAWAAYPCVEYYRGSGKPDLETKVMLYTMPIYFGVYMIAAPFGLDAFAWARFLLVIMAVITHWIFLSQHFSFPVMSLALSLGRFLLFPGLFIIGSICADFRLLNFSWHPDLEAFVVILILLIHFTFGAKFEIPIIIRLIAKLRWMKR